MELIKYIQGFSNPFIDLIFNTITYLGGSTIGVILSLILFWCTNKRLGYKFLYAILFSFSLNIFIKGVFNSPRPVGVYGIHNNKIPTTIGSSFPSGHSQVNATVFTFLINQYRNIYIWIIGIFMIIMIPISRLYFGFHWPKDVIAGTIIGVISVFISNIIFESSFDNIASFIIYSLIFFLIIAIFFIPNNDLNKTIGSLLGLITSAIVEKNFIKFDPNGRFINHFIKCFIGLSGILIIYIIFSKFLSYNHFTLLKYFSMVTWAILISPYIFIKLKLCKITR